MKQKSGLQSLVEGLCPQCRSEKMFASSAYSRRFLEMHKKCSCCGLVYEREPGFFYGAMYVSYILSVGIFLTCGAAVYLVANDPPTWVYLTSVTVISLLLYPINYRLSRSIFLHLFAGMKFRPEKMK